MSTEKGTKWAVRTQTAARDALVEYFREKQRRVNNSKGLVSLLEKQEAIDLDEVHRRIEVGYLYNDQVHGFVFPAKVKFGPKGETTKLYLVRCSDGNVFAD